MQQGALLAAISAGLYLTARSNYLVFHSLVELSSVVVALSVFVIAWSSRRYLENAYLLVVAVAYLFLGFLDLLHALAYPSMRVFAEQTYQANQLWIAARSMEALSLLAGFCFLDVRRRPNRFVLLAIYAATTTLTVLAIFRWKVFPVCFVEGVGQTPFKLGCEYAIIAVLVASLALLYARRASFDPRVRGPIAASIVFAILGEFAFTLYEGPFDDSNMMGHFFKLFSYVGIYVALVESCVERPFELIFRELNTANARLTEEIAAHTRSEAAKDAAIASQLAAMEEIRTLRGIIPICAHCKKVRDDRGAWSQVEAYIQKHSEAQFSHGICPDCYKEHFAQFGTLTPTHR